MSGSLVAAGLSAGFSLAGVAFPGFGTVSVGDFTAFGMEVPERLRWGGDQKLAVHKLLGGDRVVDILGPDEADIGWSGLLTGPLAQSRALQLDSIRQAGQPVPLVWPGGYRQVIVKDFKVSIESGGFVCPYEINCLILPASNEGDSAGAAALADGSGSAPSVTTQVGADTTAGYNVGSAAQTGTQVPLNLPIPPLPPASSGGLG